MQWEEARDAARVPRVVERIVPGEDAVQQTALREHIRIGEHTCVLIYG